MPSLIIPPRDLPDAVEVFATDSLVVDNGSTVSKATPVQVVDAGRPWATIQQAQAGTEAGFSMSPLTVAAAIAAQAGEGVIDQFSNRAAFLAAVVSPGKLIIEFQAGGQPYALVRASGGPIVQANGQEWRPLSEASPEMFSDTWGSDAGPGLRAARDWLVSQGGGTIRLARRTYPITTTETRNVYSIGSETSGVGPAEFGLALPLGVSLLGPSSGRATLHRNGGGTAAVISLENYGNGALRDLIIRGPGSANNTMHGILCSVTSAGEWTIDGMILDRVTVRNVGSYGIGQQYCGQRRSVVRDCETENTGSDGIDWKIRGPLGQQTPSETITFENNRIKTFGVRLPGTSSTGFGLRGQAQIRGLWVYDIGPGQVGLQIAPGINDVVRADLRKSAFYTEVDGVYCEGRDPRAAEPAVGVEVFAVDRCIISNVIAKHCILRDQIAGASPPAALHGPVWKSCLVVPPHNATWAAEINLARTSMDIEVQSDYDLFDVRAGTATVGQTVFTLPLGAPTANFAVTRNGVKITTGFTVSGSTLTLTTGLGATEAVCVVYPAQRAVRVFADYAVVRGSCDEFTPNPVSFATASPVATGNTLGFVWRGRRGVDMVNSTTVAGITASGPDANVNLQMGGKGTGLTVLNRPAVINVPTSVTGLAPGTLWNDAGTAKFAP